MNDLERMVAKLLINKNLDISELEDISNGNIKIKCLDIRITKKKLKERLKEELLELLVEESVESFLPVDEVNGG